VGPRPTLARTRSTSQGAFLAGVRPRQNYTRKRNNKSGKQQKHGDESNYRVEPTHGVCRTMTCICFPGKGRPDKASREPGFPGLMYQYLQDEAGSPDMHMHSRSCSTSLELERSAVPHLGDTSSRGMTDRLWLSVRGRHWDCGLCSQLACRWDQGLLFMHGLHGRRA
jgi:hypothetical protein